MKKELRIPYIDAIEFNSNQFREASSHIEVDCVNWPDQFPDNRHTEVYAAHDSKNIFLRFCCQGPDLKAVVDKDLGPVANDSCVEFFVCPDAAGSRYWNFEFNAIGHINASTRITRPEPRRLSLEELSSIKTFPSEGREPFEEKNGDFEWRLDVIIPLELLGVELKDNPIEMRGNFYKCAGKTSSPHYLSWAPIKIDTPDFHRPEYFCSIILEPKADGRKVR